MEKNKNIEENKIVLYQDDESNVYVTVRYENETFWLNQRAMAELFKVEISTINEHLKNIFESGELEPSATIRKFPIVQIEGTRQVTRQVLFYNLDAIIAVG